MNRTGSPRILILGGDLAGNNGDRAIRAVIMDQVRRVAPSARVFGVSREPQRDEEEFGLQVVAPSAVALLGRPAFLRSLDLTLFGGGQLLQDNSSQVKNMHWATVLRGVRAFSRGALMGCGLGIGPLDTPLGRFSAARALRALHGCVVRDRRSAEWVARLTGGSLPAVTLPDPAVALRPESPENARRFLSDVEKVDCLPGELLVGVTLRQFFPGRMGFLPSAWTARWRAADPGFETFKATLAESLNRFARGRKVRVLCFPLYQASWQNDAEQARDLARRLAMPAHVLGLSCRCSMVKALMGLCDLFVGVAMHSSILAMGKGVPTLGLSYADKTTDLFQDLGLAEWAVPVEALHRPGQAGLLAEKITQLHDRREAVRHALRQAWADREARVDRYAEWLERALRPHSGRGVP